jgi:hypothetical protein
MMDAPSCAGLLTAVDDLLSFVDGIEPVAIEATPDPNSPGCGFRRKYPLPAAREDAVFARMEEGIRQRVFGRPETR